ncbi:MAG: hypothetical protein AB7P08_03675 [Burkholderiales bacterium]
MRRPRLHITLGLCVGLSAAQAIAGPLGTAQDPAATAPAVVETLLVADAKAASSGDKAAQGAESRKVADGSGKQPPKSSRLRFRSADGTCACTCASGGTSEDEIRKAQEARERAER